MQSRGGERDGRNRCRSGTQGRSAQPCCAGVRRTSAPSRRRRRCVPSSCHSYSPNFRSKAKFHSKLLRHAHRVSTRRLVALRLSASRGAVRRAARARALYQRPVKVAADVKPVPHRLPDLHRRCHKGFRAKYCCDRKKLPARRMAFQKVCSVADASHPACLGSRAICWFTCCLNNAWTTQPH